MATVRKFRNNWVADYTDQWGRRHREKPDGAFENMAQQRRAALALLNKRLEQVDRGTYSTRARNLTYAHLAEDYLASKVNLRPSTRRSYESLLNLYLVPYFGRWKARQISAADIERFRNELAQGRPPPIRDAFAERLRSERPGLSRARARQRASRKAPGVRTINKALTVLSMTFNYAARHRWVDFNPAEHVEKLKPAVSVADEVLDTNILTPGEIGKLLQAADEPTWTQAGKLARNNTRLLIKVAVFTGLRSGELRGLQWGDIDWGTGQLFVRRAWKEGQFHKPKTHASIRRVEIPGSIVGELREWRMACPKGEYDLVFPNLKGNPLSNENLLQRAFYPALRRAGLRKVRFHDLRHTFASLLIANGEDLVRVSRLLGHASPAVTLRVYAHMLPNDHYGTSELLERLIIGSPVPAGSTKDPSDRAPATLGGRATTSTICGVDATTAATSQVLIGYTKQPTRG